MRPTNRETAVTVRRSGVHTCRLEIGNLHFTGPLAEFAALAQSIEIALQDNRID